MNTNFGSISGSITEPDLIKNILMTTVDGTVVSHGDTIQTGESLTISWDGVNDFNSIHCSIADWTVPETFLHYLLILFLKEIRLP